MSALPPDPFAPDGLAPDPFARGDLAGALPVGRLDALPALSGLAVRSLRRWCEGGPSALACDLAGALGPERGARAAGSLHDLCAHLLAAARRPPLAHAPCCACLGSDEAAFAELVRLAGAGAREDALMLAVCMVRPDRAPLLAHLAEQAGLQLARALLRPARPH